MKHPYDSFTTTQCPATGFTSMCKGKLCPLFEETVDFREPYSDKSEKEYEQEGFTVDWRDPDGDVQMSRPAWKCGLGGSR